MSGQGAIVREALSWKNVLSEFAHIPPVVKAMAEENRSYEITRMLQEPVYQLLEQVIANSTIIFSPPKVAGQTITATIWGHPGLPEPKHVHFLSDKGFAFMESLVDRCRFPLKRHRWHESITQSRWVRVLLTVNRILRGNGMSFVPKPVLIAGVREPMAQYISLVFEHWWMYVDHFEKITADTIGSLMLSDPWRQHCNTWFQDELGEITGIDVFSRPFPTERGWEIYENEHARVLIIRQENFERLPEALGNLYGIDPGTIVMETRNVAENKDYSAAYAAVKDTWRPTEQELALVYSQPTVNLFYSPAEIAKFQARWKAPVVAPRATPSIAAKTAEVPAAQPEQTKKVERRTEPANVTASPGSKPARHPHHPSTCRPCTQCAAELQEYPLVKQASQERLEMIQRDRSFFPIWLMLKLRGLLRKVTRLGKTART